MAMRLALQNKIVAVTGSSQGIGLSIAEAFLSEGSRVCISGRDAERLQRANRELSEQFGQENVSSYCGDLTNSKTVVEFATHLENTWGGVDILICNVGSGRGKLGWDLDEEEWDRLFSMNFWSAVKVSRACLPILLKRTHDTSIVFISSIAGAESLPAPLPYCAAKAALINYSKNLSRQVARQGLRVNCVAPGNIYFEGGSWEAHVSSRRDEVLAYIEREVPLNRFGTPDEIAWLVVYLCSERATFISGACFVADGGQTRIL